MGLKTKKLQNHTSKYFDEAWKIYEDSFPTVEKRTLSEQKYIINDKRYTANVFLDQEKVVGILFYWEFQEHTFIEHFAVSPFYRGNSYGSSILLDFLEKHNNVVLEIELLHDDISKRRYEFYKRFGFMLNEHKHFQVPFRKDAKELELLLLSLNRPILKKEYKNLYEEMKESLSV